MHIYDVAHPCSAPSSSVRATGSKTTTAARNPDLAGPHSYAVLWAAWVSGMEGLRLLDEARLWLNLDRECARAIKFLWVQV